MPPKKQDTKDIRSFFMKSAKPGSSSSLTATESAEPGEAAGPRPGGAAGPRPGGAAGPRPGGAAGPRRGGAAGPRRSGAASPRRGGAADSQTAKSNQARVKKENDGESTDGHSHRFTVKFQRTGQYELDIYCDQPRTVLQVIKSSESYAKETKKRLDENAVIQLGKQDRKSIVATHFPCSCISDDECLIMSFESEKVEKEEEAQRYQTIHSRDKYSVFYIDTEGGLYTKKKKLFRNSAVKQYKFLCVYGEKGMTLEEALKRDGRFIDDLGGFTLSDNDNPSCITERTRKVDNLDEKAFKIRLPRNVRANDEKQQEKTCASNNATLSCDTRSVLDAVRQKGVSVRAAVDKSGSAVNTQEIYEILHKQFPDLKRLMESRFPDDSYREELNLRKEDFGKIQQSFSEVHVIKKLLKLGKSVCKVVIAGVREGTGFVLFDNFILTNGHLFKGCVEGERLNEGINVFVLFNNDDPEPHINFYYFQLADPRIYYSEDDLDYAIFQLSPEGWKPNQTIPPGLLEKFGPLPTNGEACIIGHPAGGVKKIDPTCIIEKEKREKAVNDNLLLYKNNDFIVHSIRDIIKNQGIENIMMGGKDFEKVVTYNTFMYHGSSGSPVFDARGQVFGLHTAGFAFEVQNHKDSVIEFAQPLLAIFEDFVSKLKKSGEVELLGRVERKAKRNNHLKKVLNSRAADTEDPHEHSDSNESMQID